MGEIFPDHLNEPAVLAPEKSGVSSGETTLSYRDRLRQGLGRLTEGTASLVDVSAGVALARDDLRRTRRAMDMLDEPYSGVMERHAAGGTSSTLQATIGRDFRRDARQAGFTELDSMPAELRMATAHAAVGRYSQDIAQELRAFHPEWSDEDLEAAAIARVEDFTRLLSMTTEEYGTFAEAHMQYEDLRSATAEIQTELNELRANRNERLARIGRAALRGVLNFAGRVRNAPHALSARVVVAGMSLTDRMRSLSPENRRKVFWGTAAGIAFAGIASYIAMRAGHSRGPSGSYIFASSDTPLIPDHIGSATQTPLDHVGTAAAPADSVGTFTVPTDHLGTQSADLPGHVGTEAFTPTHHVGTDNTPPVDHMGSQNAPSDHIGSSSDLPTHVGGGGESLATAQTSSEIFGDSGRVTNWPDTIRVSKWNAQNLDGSLTGISRQMLVRSGVEHPSNGQVQALVDVLRPQAQSNGYLLQDQVLDLRPATKALRSLLQK